MPALCSHLIQWEHHSLVWAADRLPAVWRDAMQAPHRKGWWWWWWLAGC